MGRPFLFSTPRIPRSFFHLRWRIALVLFVTAFCHQQHLFVVSRRSLAAKYSSTHFEASHRGLHPRFSRPDDEDADFQNRIIANRAAWKVLDKGWEGKVYAYKDSVIKTFTPGRSPFRNCAPGEEDEKWPTEIAASLRFGGHGYHKNQAASAHDYDANNSFDGFLPVKTFFKAAPDLQSDPEWHLVTPLLKGGNLNTLAKKVSQNPNLNTVRKADAHYRPTFESLLSNMQRLHDAKYCHDDIKPENIFVEDDTHWLLGDLGNLRHMSHPYHTSRLWVDNDQLRDCRANDAMRALKSYIQFLKKASGNKDTFSEDFMDGKEPFSRLFWIASADAPNISAAQIHKISVEEYPERPAMLRASDDMPQYVRDQSRSAGLFRRSSLERSVNRLLETRIGEKLVRFWGLVGILGLPESEGCGF